MPKVYLPRKIVEKRLPFLGNVLDIQKIKYLQFRFLQLHCCTLISPIATSISILELFQMVGFLCKIMIFKTAPNQEKIVIEEKHKYCLDYI